MKTNERKGKYFKLFSLEINNIKRYFIITLNPGGITWSFKYRESAVDMFEKLERLAELGELQNYKLLGK